MCPSGVTYLSADCCFNELALLKSNYACLSSIKWTSSSYHWKSTCSRHDIAEKLLSWCKQPSLTHSITNLIAILKGFEIPNRKLKDRQYDDQTKQDDTDLQNTAQKTKDWATQTPLFVRHLVKYLVYLSVWGLRQISER